jgi:hypothetical protein
MRPALKIALVVFAILLVVGVFLPIVVRLRDTSARMDCANNLKQIVLAVHNYQDTYGWFPRGTHPSPSLPPEKRLSWFVEIAPFVEADNVPWWSHENESWDSPGNCFLRIDRQVFLCPSGKTLRSPSTLGLTHYVGIAGVGADAATYPMGDTRIGMFGYDRQVTIKDVTDGLTNTLMIMETRRENGPWAAGGPPTIRGIDTTDEPYIGPHHQFGGMHRNGSRVFGRLPFASNCAMGDASVRRISAEIDPRILEKAATIAGGDLFGQDW